MANEIERSIERKKKQNEAQTKIRAVWREFRFNKMKKAMLCFLNFHKYQQNYVAQRDEIEFQNRIKRRHEQELRDLRRGVDVAALSVAFEPRTFDDSSTDAVALWLKKKFPV